MVHKSVLLAETLENMNISPLGLYLDATLGGGGHSFEIASRLKGGMLIGVDQDDFALAQAGKRLAGFGEPVRLIKSNFSQVQYIMKTVGISSVHGVLMDLGVSSFQLDDADRGFSYMHNAPLDMRMNRDDTLSAYDVINTYSQSDLRRIFYEYGEERWSSRVAEFVVAQRAKEPVETTFELVSIIKAAIPKNARKDGPHPAKRIFQAIRIEVNSEIAILGQAIEDFVEILAPNGRICIITFHSLEDRIVKSVFSKLKNPCTCPREFPLCMCGKVSKVEIITKKPIAPSEAELEENPRARSAKLRVAQKI